MLVVMHPAATADEIEAVVQRLTLRGLKAEPLPGGQRVAIGVLGNKEYLSLEEITRLAGVAEIIHVTKPYKLVSREFYPEDTTVTINGAVFGGPDPVMIAGPCSVETEAQLLASARFLQPAFTQSIFS